MAINRGSSAFSTVKLGTTQISKVMRGTTLIWENWSYTTGVLHNVYYSSCCPPEVTLYSSSGTPVKNPTVYIYGSFSNGDGFPYDSTYLRVRGKRQSDGVWDTLISATNGADVNPGSTVSWSQTVNVTNGVIYTQFEYYGAGAGSNGKTIDGKLTAWYQQ